MLTLLAQLVVVKAALYLLGLGLVALARPAMARRFLRGFATARGLHFLEMGLRILVGLAFVHVAPLMQFSQVFLALGWLLIVTSAVLVLLPWDWHRRFAARSVPQALKFLPLIGVSSLAAGVAILGCLFPDGP
ncbi:hypothetical protein [Arenimonas sp. MALMAid1274]|uniref:hypothetical protein n=1 Tax=Arenimonas sp. MALMAid1274 TaxID=3411630 RepID=UPI003BA00752